MQGELFSLTHNLLSEEELHLTRWHLQIPEVCIALIVFFILCRAMWSVSRDCKEREIRNEIRMFALSVTQHLQQKVCLLNALLHQFVCYTSSSACLYTYLKPTITWQQLNPFRDVDIINMTCLSSN